MPERPLEIHRSEQPAPDAMGEGSASAGDGPAEGALAEAARSPATDDVPAWPAEVAAPAPAERASSSPAAGSAIAAGGASPTKRSRDPMVVVVVVAALLGIAGVIALIAIAIG